jgi:hypothetical protein
VKLDDLLRDVDKRWHQAFIQFVQTGEAPEDFLAYLNKDPKGQSAVERAFTAQVEALQGLAEVIKKKGDEKLQSASELEQPSMAIARAVELVMELPGSERREAVAGAAAALVQRTGARGSAEVRSTLSELGEQLSLLAQ